MKGFYTIKCMINLTEFFRASIVNLGRGTILRTASFILLKKLNKQEIIMFLLQFIRLV